MKLSKKILSCLLAVLVLVSFSFISSAKTVDKAAENDSRCIGYIIHMFASETDSDDDSFATGTDSFSTETDSGSFFDRVIDFFRNIFNTIVDFFTGLFAKVGLN